MLRVRFPSLAHDSTMTIGTIILGTLVALFLIGTISIGISIYTEHDFGPPIIESTKDSRYLEADDFATVVVNDSLT